MHIYIQDSDRNCMKMNKNARVWAKLKFNFNFVHFFSCQSVQNAVYYFGADLPTFSFSSFSL